ncbi:MAG: glycosyltransferase family 2 protein [Gammaproteobacteria bacterium]|nr:glycosyltransferase family 2 protein [Gammaproteobacteria bacterium]
MNCNTLNTQCTTAFPKLSVIIAVYHTEKYLPKCLDSVKLSTLKEIEIIIVDDASVPSCHHIVKEYKRFDSRIHYIRHTKNRGLLEARRSGLEFAKGDYIAFLDPDDTISNTIYELAYKRAIELDAFVLFFNVQQCDEKGFTWVEKYNSIPEFKNRTGYQIFNEVMFNHSTAWIWHVSWNKIIKREVAQKTFLKISKQHLIMFEDLLWSSSLYLELKNKPVFSSINNIGITYFRNNESITINENYKQSLKKITDIFYVLKYLKTFLKYHKDYVKYIESYNETKKQILSRYEPNFPPIKDIWLLLPYIVLKVHYYLYKRTINKDELVPNVSIDEAEKIILKRIDKKNDIKNVCIYGTGELGQRLFNAFIKRGLKINYFILTSSSEGEFMKGISVLSPELALDKGEENFVIASIGSYTQIAKELQNCALHKGKKINIIGLK